MVKKELDEILNSYKWIKVKGYVEQSLENPMVEWKSEYNTLLKHHKKETTFLIDKCRELACEVLKLKSVGNKLDIGALRIKADEILKNMTKEDFEGWLKKDRE